MNLARFLVTHKSRMETNTENMAGSDTRRDADTLFFLVVSTSITPLTCKKNINANHLGCRTEIRQGAYN